MADKFFLKSGSIYKATSKRLQNDIEVTGADIVEAANRIQEVNTGSPYKSYVAIISQVGEEAPTAIVLNGADANYLGDIVWSRTGIGNYAGTLIGAFIVNKTFLTLTPNGSNISIFLNDADSVRLETYSTGYLDEVLYQTPFEIRVYQ